MKSWGGGHLTSPGLTKSGGGNVGLLDMNGSISKMSPSAVNTLSVVVSLNFLIKAGSRDLSVCPVSPPSIGKLLFAESVLSNAHVSGLSAIAGSEWLLNHLTSLETSSEDF